VLVGVLAGGEALIGIVRGDPQVPGSELSPLHPRVPGWPKGSTLSWGISL
jgi:hypothetical protein